MFITWNCLSGWRYVRHCHREPDAADRQRRAERALVPTTTASAGAQYNITYNQNGVNQFTQVWAVPPSTVPLRVSDCAGVDRNGSGACAGHCAGSDFRCGRIV